MTSVKRLLAVGLPLLGFLMTASTAQAAPGAHGPNGEHLDGPAQTSSGASGAPRFETKSEAFEMVGRLQGGELSIFVNRFETNEPVLDATVELEAGNVKAKALFHSDLGDYAVDDAAFIEAISRPGQHPLVIMVVAGADADLLEATLTVPAVAAPLAEEHPHVWWERRIALYGAAGLAALFAVATLLTRRRRPSVALKEESR
jgi:hypothetical protein